MKNFVIHVFSMLFILATVNTATANLHQFSKSNSEHTLSVIDKSQRKLFYPGSLAILPEDGRTIYFEAFAAAKREIRIEICVLEDPLILQSLQNALRRGVKVRVIVDNRKYQSTPDEQVNLATYLTQSGGELHLSNPIFPRSFPKVILIDDRFVLISSACLDSTTFAQYRDYTYVSNSCCTIQAMSELFENDWQYSASLGLPFPTFNPTPPIHQQNLIVAPVDASAKLVSFIQQAERTLDVTSELLGNPTLESELSAAVAKGVLVRLIAPEIVNGATPEMQELQITSLNQLKAAGIHVHVTTPPETQQFPYMHARTAISDGKRVYLGSISLSPDSTTYNRGVGIILKKKHVVNKMKRQFKIDYHSKSHNF